MSWISNRSSQESLAILGQLSETCASLGGPLAKNLNQFVRDKDYNYLVNYKIDYNDVTLSVEDAIYSRQILGLFQKLEFLKLGVDRDAVAADRFVKSERMCLETNLRFELATKHPNLMDADVAAVLYRSQRKIAAVLGEAPSIGELTYRFGSGANTNVRSALACPRAKLSARLECSTNLLPLVAEFLSEVPAWMALHSSSELENEFFNVEVDVVTGELMFVLKNAQTNRSICKEPLLNSFFQKGVGSYMKERLMRSGINLRDQTINQKLALRGSVSGEVATVDAVMASDCVSCGLVWDQIPYDWACLLDTLRTPYIRLPDVVTQEIVDAHRMTGFMVQRKPHCLQKFSGMGNAFTFELESVLFYGLCSGVVEFLGLDCDLVSVYGDDLIVPSEAYPLLEKVLSFCGFSLNREKSFCSGPFRESCGADYFHGFDIRPFYQKTLVSGRTLFVMHNWFIRHGEFSLAKVVLSHCKQSERLFGPDGYGDGHLIGSYHIRTNRDIKRQGWDGGFFDTYQLKANRFTDVLPGDAVLPAYSVYTRSGALDPTDPDVVKGSNGYRRISIYTLTRTVFRRVKA